jgi:hypothetical protein
MEIKIKRNLSYSDLYLLSIFILMKIDLYFQILIFRYSLYLVTNSTAITAHL